jgi:hypothetical protein
MNDEVSLPLLPKPAIESIEASNMNLECISYFTPDQMHEYAMQAVLAERARNLNEAIQARNIS